MYLACLPKENRSHFMISCGSIRGWKRREILSQGKGSESLHPMLLAAGFGLSGDGVHRMRSEPDSLVSERSQMLTHFMVAEALQGLGDAL